MLSGVILDNETASLSPRENLADEAKMILENVYVPNLILLCFVVLYLGISIGVVIESRKRKYSDRKKLK